MHRLVGADALEDGVGADAVGELGDRAGALLAALGDDVGGAEAPGDLLAGLVARHRDDALGAELGGGEHAAQADRAVADHDGGARPASTPADDGGVPAGGHHVGEREQRRDQRRGRACRRS